MMFRPTVACKIKHKTGVNAYGETTYSEFQDSMCDVLELTLGFQKTPVGGTYTASRGSADEDTGIVRLLLDPSTPVVVNDVVQVNGSDFILNSVRIRYDVFGVLDHYEVGGTIE